MVVVDFRYGIIRDEMYSWRSVRGTERGRERKRKLKLIICLSPLQLLKHFIAIKINSNVPSSLSNISINYVFQLEAHQLH